MYYLKQKSVEGQINFVIDTLKMFSTFVFPFERGISKQLNVFYGMYKQSTF